MRVTRQINLQRRLQLSGNHTRATRTETIRTRTPTTNQLHK